MVDMDQNTPSKQEENNIISEVIKPETEQILDPKSKSTTIEKERKSLKSVSESGIVAGAVGDESIKENRLIEQHKKEQEEEEKNKIAKQLENEKKAKLIQNDIDKLTTNIEYAKQNGLPSKALETRLQELESNKKTLINIVEPIEASTQQEIIQPQQSTIQPKQQETISQPDRTIASTEQKMEKSPFDIEASQAEVLEKAQQLKNQRINIQAQILNTQDEIAKQRQLAEKAMQSLRDEDLKLTKIDNNRFWKEKSTWQKIGLGIAMLLGGSQGGRNRAVQTVQQFIERDIEAQKLNNKQKLAKREEAFRRVNLELNRLQKITDNQFKKQQLEIAKQKLAAEQVKANRERLQKAQADMMKDFILKKGIKLENLTPAQINSIFSKEDFKKAKELRDEYTKQTTKLGTRKVVNAFGDIQALVDSGEATGPTDIFLLTKAMKFIDPDSVVREGEFHIAETASPPLRMIVRLAQKFAKGTRLTQKDRVDFKKNAALLFKVKLRNQNQINDRYRSLSRQMGLPSSLVVEDFSLATISPREALVQKKMKQFKGLDRSRVEKNIDKLIDSGQLSENYRN